MIERFVTKSLVVRYRVRVGHGSPQRTFDRLADAEDYEAKEKSRRRREKAGMEVEQGPITYDELCKLFLANYTAKTKDWTEQMLAYSRKQFGSEYVRSLRPEGIGAWLHGLTLSPKTKSHILERMRAVLNMGVEWGYLSRSPVRRGAVRHPGAKRIEPIQPFESWAEVCAVADAAGKYDALIRFVCATGLRPAEWLALTWACLDLKTARMFVPGTKNEQAARTIPLSKLAINALRDIPKGLHAVPVWQIRDYAGWRRNHWNPALDAAEVARRPPYQMRHTFATLALASDVPIDTVSKLMGHSSIEVTMRYYAKYLPAKLAEQIARMDGLESEDSRGSHTANS